MNKMKEVAKLLGREMEVPFDIYTDEGIYLIDSPFIFTEKGLVNCSGWLSCAVLNGLITGEYTIKDIPFEPKKGENYWTVDFSIEDTPFTASQVWRGSAFDYERKLQGLIFKTKEQAENYIPIYEEKLRELGWTKK